MYFALTGPSANKDTLLSKIETDTFQKHATIAGNSIYLWGEIYNTAELIGEASTRLSKEINGIAEALLVLYEHKNDFAAAINGHFAIIIVDNFHNKILVLNDRFNAIPAFYYCSQKTQTLVIADDIKKIAAHRDVVTATDWEYYFQSRSKNGKATVHPTFAENIFLLEGGCCLSLNVFNFETACVSYWNMEDAYFDNLGKNRLHEQEEEEVVATFRHLFMNSVALRSSNADETAVLLSGGYDSGSIAAALTDAPGVWYTACTFNSILNDELNRTYDLSGSFGCDHNIIPFSLKQGISPDDWCRTVWTAQNVNTSLDFFVKNQLVVHLQQAYPQIKYILSGYGSDQLLGGTTLYDLSEGRKHPTWKDFFQKLVEYERTEMVAGQQNAVYQFSQNFFSRSYMPAFRLNQHHEYWLSYLERKRLSQTNVYSQLESQLCLQNGFLSRYPFWDNHLVDFMLAIPKQLHGTLFFDKALLRKAMKGILPASYDAAPKFKSPMPFKNHIIFQFLRPILYGNNYQLLDRIFSESTTFSNVFNKDLLFGFLKYNEQSNYFSAYSFVLEIINMGLLDLLLQQKDEASQGREWAFQAIAINDKNRGDSYARVNYLLDLHRYKINYDFPVVKWMPIEVLRSESGDQQYLKVENDLIPVRSHGMSHFIRSIDGVHSLNEILRDKQLDLTDIEPEILHLVSIGAIGFENQQ